MKAQAQMAAGDQGITENLSPAQKGAVSDGHHQAAVRTVQDREVPRTGQGGQSRLSGRLTRRATAQRGRGLGPQEPVAVRDGGGGAHCSRIAAGDRHVAVGQPRVWTTSPFGDAPGHCGHGRIPV